MFLRKIVLALFILLIVGGSGAAQAGKITIGLVVSDQRRGDLDVEVLNAATQALFKTQRFRLMERERLDKIIDEKGLQEFIGALTSGDSSAGIEELEGVDLIGLVSYTVEPTRGLEGQHLKGYYMSVRLISVKTGQIAQIVDSRREGLYEPTTPNQAGIYLFQNAREAFPPEEYIVQLQGTNVVVAMGSGVGLKEGDVLEVIRDGGTIFHPITGKELPGEEIVVGTLKVTRASAQISSCKVTKKEGSLEIGDIVRLKPKNQTGLKVFGKFKKLWKRKG